MSRLSVLYCIWWPVGNELGGCQASGEGTCQWSDMAIFHPSRYMEEMNSLKTCKYLISCTSHDPLSHSTYNTSFCYQAFSFLSLSSISILCYSFYAFFVNFFLIHSLFGFFCIKDAGVREKGKESKWVLKQEVNTNKCSKCLWIINAWYNLKDKNEK